MTLVEQVAEGLEVRGRPNGRAGEKVVAPFSTDSWPSALARTFSTSAFRITCAPPPGNSLTFRAERIRTRMTIDEVFAE